MTVRELIKDMNRYKKQHGKDFLEWKIYTEQCSEGDKKYKRTKQKWEIHKAKDGLDDYEYFHVIGGLGSNPNKKILTINVNY